MKKSTIAIVLTAALAAMGAAQASDFSGAWVGAKAGVNNTHANSVDTKNATTFGIEGGYNWDLGPYTLGALLFADNNASASHNAGQFSYGSKSYGLDSKLGMPMGNWLPYGKLGYVKTTANGALATAFNGSYHSFNAGFGVEYKFAPHLSAAVEYMATNARNNPGNKLVNNNLTVGLNYYFDAPVVAAAVPAVVAAAPVAAPAPVVVAPAPVVTPAPVVVAPAPAPKTIFTDKPVTIEGASFDTGSAKLKPTANKQLDQVVEFAAKYKEANLTVDGYTDSRGKEAANKVLSTKRAESVKAYLVKKGVAANRIMTAGNGSAKPIGDNNTVAGRALNRRVEINSVIRVAK